jgi:hypothetical protein
MNRTFAIAISALTFVAPTVLASQASAAAKPAKAPTAAGAADLSSAFCTQLAASQKAIGATTGSMKQKNAKIAAEWVKIEGTAPASIKSDVATVRAAFTKAATQDDVAAKATLGAIGVSSKAIGTFVATTCTRAGGKDGDDDRGPGGQDGFDPAKMAELRACMEKNGASMPDPANGGARPNFDDPKFQAAAQKCGFGGPGGRNGEGGPGQGGRGGRGMSEAVRACVAAKGITLPTRPGRAAGSDSSNGAGSKPAAAKPANGAGSAGAGGGRNGRTPFDAKTQAAIDACRAANPAK